MTSQNFFDLQCNYWDKMQGKEESLFQTKLCDEKQ